MAEQTFWQWWAGQRYSKNADGYDNARLHEACPPLRTRSVFKHELDIDIDWMEPSRTVVLHCWDVFCCHWPQVFCAAVFGRP